MIAHIDADAFFASVLQRDHPKLRGKPVIALGMSGGTTVIAASYEAKKLGVKTGMRTREARELAPNAVALPADFRATGIASQHLKALMERACPGGVEWASVDEGYLDLALPPLERGRARVGVPHINHPPSPTLPPLTQGERAEWEAFARSLQAEVQRCLDLPVSIGIAATKTLAKMASKKNKPRGICVVLTDSLPSFLTSLPINAIPGIGIRSTPKLQMIGLRTALDFAHAPPSIIQQLLGKTGLELQAEVRGIKVYDIVTTPPPPKSISRCRSFLPTGDKNFLFSQLLLHLQYCVSRLRREGLECTKISAWLRTTLSSSEATGRIEKVERKLPRHVAEEALMIPFLKEAFEETLQHVTLSPSTLRRTGLTKGTAPKAQDASRRPAPTVILRCERCEPRRSVPVRALGAGFLSMTPMFTQAGVILSDFRQQGPRQADLFEDTSRLERVGKVQQALDTLRERFGRGSVGYFGTLTKKEY